MAEVHQFPDCLVLVGLNKLASMVVGHLNIAGESQVCAVEVHEPCGDVLETLDVVDHATQRQIAKFLFYCQDNFPNKFLSNVVRSSASMFSRSDLRLSRKSSVSLSVSATPEASIKSSLK